MDKKQLTESDIRARYITPAIEQAGWDPMTQIFHEFGLRAGRISVRGRAAHRDQRTVLKADYALFFKPNIPIAAVEAKDNNHGIGAGMLQAIEYARLLGVPFAFASNGDGFIFRDETLADGVLEKEIALHEFPSPQQLWDRYCTWKGWTPQVRSVAEFDYYPGKTPRYYQINAVNRAVEAIAAGQKRVLLVMATGTGKTFTAFQIIHRLWKSPWRNDPSTTKPKRILFLADRNILIDQTMVNDFRPFKGAMAKLSPNAKGIEVVDAQGKVSVEAVDLAINKSTKQVNKSYEIYLSLYQAVTGTEEERNIYKQFSPDFFDLIVVDECHRGSADEDSAWHDILNYFSGATHVGLTATPKETKDVSNTDYFGKPVYTYSLKQGIEDGFLAPYKVIRVDLDKDAFGWRPSAGMTPIAVATEDELSEAIALRLISELQQPVYLTNVLRKGGFGYLRAKMDSWRQMAQQQIMLVLTDLDRANCVVEFRDQWLAGRPAPDRLLLRIAVREVEAWVLADHVAMSELLGKRVVFPVDPDGLPDPKQTLMQFAKKASKPIRDDLIKFRDGQLSQGLGYNARLADWVNTVWCPQRAAALSPSLARARSRLQSAAVAFGT